MGRRDEGAGEHGWNDEDEDDDEDGMMFDDEDDDLSDSETTPGDTEARASRQPGAGRLLARRLIEQAREQQELSESLADFDDYVV